MIRGLATPILRRAAVEAGRVLGLDDSELAALDRGELPMTPAVVCLLVDGSSTPARAMSLLAEARAACSSLGALLATDAGPVQRARAWQAAAVGGFDFADVTRVLEVLARRHTRATEKAAAKRAAIKPAASAPRPALRLLPGGAAPVSTPAPEVIPDRAFADAIEEATGGLVSGDELIESFSGPLAATAKRAAARGLGPSEWAGRVRDLCTPAIESGRATARLVISSLIREAVAGRNDCVSAWDLARTIAAAVTPDDDSPAVTAADVVVEVGTKRLVAAAATIPDGDTPGMRLWVAEYVDAVTDEHGEHAERLPRCYVGERAATAWAEWKATMAEVWADQAAESARLAADEPLDFDFFDQ